MTELQLLQLRFNKLESTLLNLNVAERLLECERELIKIRNGELGLYPKKRYENEIKNIKKKLKIK